MNRTDQVAITKTPQRSPRREVIAYDGTDVAKITVVQDGVTKTCTLTLPNGRPTCQ